MHIIGYGTSRGDKVYGGNCQDCPVGSRIFYRLIYADIPLKTGIGNFFENFLKFFEKSIDKWSFVDYNVQVL